MRFLQLFIMLFIFSISNAQTNPDTSIVSRSVQTDDEIKIFTKTEIPASYPKGEKYLFSYIDSNLNKQVLFNNGASKGDYNITIRFIIKKDGSAYDFKPETQSNFGIENEIIRILKTIPKWEPAKQNNRLVYAYYRLKTSMKL